MDLSDLSIDSLDLDLVPPPSRGRRKAEVHHGFERELTKDDIALLIANPLRGSETPSLVKLKQSHHKLAQLLAEGVPDVEASLITGYTQSRISILKNDPAFAELLAHYSGVTKEIFINVHERLAGLGLDALEELHSRLELEPEKMSNKELMDLATLGFDRSGYGPKSTQVVEGKITVSGLLSEVKEEIRKRTDGNIKTLDIRPNKPSPSSDSGAPVSGASSLPPGQHSDPSDSGSEGGGAAVRAERWEEPVGAVVPFQRRES